MAINARKVKSNGGGFRQPPIDAGTYPARLVQVIDLGIQAREPYKGQAKPPVQMISLTYELLDEFCVNEDGEVLEDKPRWVSEQMPLYNLEADKAKSTERYNGLDPEQVHEGDFGALVGQPCMVTIAQNKKGDKVYCNVASVAPMRAKEAAKAPELVNKAAVFELEDPDLEVFNSFPQFMQDKIKANIEFEGSVLDELLNGKKGKKKPEPEPEPEEDDEEEEEADDNW